MATGVEELVDMLFAMIDEAKSVPLSSEKCIIERDKALDLLDDIKAQFPMELSEAKKLIAARADYIASAKREADLMKKQAEEQARQMVDEDELMAKARIPDGVKVSTNAFHIPASKGLIAASRYASHLVVGSRGLSGLDAHFLGSVSRQIVNFAECTVTVVH